MESKLGFQLVPAAPEPLTGHNGKVWSVSWSPRPCNGADSMLASCGEDGSIIWQCIDFEWSIYKRLAGKSICTCAWRPDGKVLAVAGCNSRVVLWEYKEDKASFECIKEINGPWNQVIKGVSWNKDGEYLLFFTEDGVIFIVAKSNMCYDAQRVERAFDMVDISCGAWHPTKNQFVVSGCQKFKIYEVSKLSFDQQKTIAQELCVIGGPGFTFQSHRGMISAISYSKTGRIASAGADGKVLFWEFEEHKPKAPKDTINLITKHLIPRPIMKLDLSEPIMCIDWSRSENDFVAAGCITNTISMYSQTAFDKLPKMLDRENRENLSKIYAHDEPINDVKWDTQGSLLASASSDGKIKLWKVDGDLEVSTSCSHKDQLATKRHKTT